MGNVKKRQTRKPVKQPGQSSSPPFLLIRFGHQQHCGLQDDARRCRGHRGRSIVVLSWFVEIQPKKFNV